MCESSDKALSGSTGGKVMMDETAILAMADERDRLREALERWQATGCPNCSGDCGSANPPVMDCIMIATSHALGEENAS